MKKIYHLLNLSDEIKEAESKYNYQPMLTKKLDNYQEEFSEMTLLEIVLWKTNRYPLITKEILQDINDLRIFYTEEKARAILRKLLSKEMKGFDLPMASTVLRFAVPDQLQIIDQRVYRFITGNDCLYLPYNIESKIELYFNYIEQLKTVCNQYNIPFYKSDRILYQLDKLHNKEIRLKTSGN